ncbi:UPF0175 family protein [Pyrobaculum ferrireducens]|uniref:Uncharacterized protein n=1 Tax=Pyrobaculum ferrireducens TaxID=1104324 RepID=G7VAN7_9CREN|nr:UPF0175 family protein [Pyrobaculum ferrireducens]AET32276.1 hypothetical protein P186_0833 [Pyrobaculum ferrireducens]
MARGAEGSLEEANLNYIVALLYLAGGCLSRLKIQKGLFIASTVVPYLSNVLVFREGGLGPWSPQVAAVLSRLRALGLVQLGRRSVCLRDASSAEVALGKLPVSDREGIGDVAELLSVASDDEVLLYVYVLHGGDRWPGMERRVSTRRTELAISLLAKGAVSLSLAARLAGMSLDDFVKELRRRGVKPFRAHPEDIEFAKKL